MPLYDNEDGTMSSATYAFDNNAALAGQPSILESAGNLVAKFAPLTILSVANSFANTGVEVANLFGADLAPLKAQDELDSWGWDDYSKYYTAHEQGIEAAGLLAGSLIPGLAAVKAVKVMQAGRLGEIAARATNLFMSPTSKVIENATSVINSGDAALFPSMSASKWQAIGLGFRDQAVQSLAFEAATYATMNQSPLLTQQSWQDVASNALYGTVFGGLVGGVVEGIGTRALFNKAYITADMATKDLEKVTNIGMKANTTYDGTSIAGDRALLALNDIYNIQDMGTTGGVLGARKASMTINNETLAAKATLQTLANPGEEYLTNALFDTIQQGRLSGNVTRNDMADMLTRLAVVKPIGSPATVPSTDFFYTNRFLRADVTAGNVSFNDLVTNAPLATADLSRRYQLAPYATGLKVASFTDNFVPTTGGEALPLFTTSKEAFDAGNDMFINNKLQVIVNPDAYNIIAQVPRPGENRALTIAEEKLHRSNQQLPEGSAPLIGAPLVMDVNTGTFKTGAIPVPGDYGPDTIKVIKQGLMFGTPGKTQLSVQSLSTPLTADTPTIDASSRYIWASRRGLERNDTITDTDVPMLEQMYREGTTAVSQGSDWDTYIQGLEKRNITLASGEDLPSTPQEMANTIQNAKDDLIHDILTDPKNVNMSSEEVARRANVPESYLENNMQASKPDDFMVDPESLAKVNHIQMEYNIGNISTPDGNIVRGLVDTQHRIQLIQDVAKTAVMKEFGSDGENYLASGFTSADATLDGARPGLLTFTNSAYGSLGERVQKIGRLATNLFIKRNGEDSMALQPLVTALKIDQQASAEWGNFVFARRSTSENYTFLNPELAQQYGLVSADGDANNVAVLTKSLIKDKNGNVVDWNANYRPQGFFPGLARDKFEDETTVAAQGLKTFYELHPTVADFERGWQNINDRLLQSRNSWYAAQGLNKSIDTGNLYAPPIDTGKYPYIALIRPTQGSAFADDSMAAITAATKESLQQKISLIDPTRFDIFNKDQIQAYHSVQGDYDYQRNFNTGLANAEMRRKGVLNDVFPDTRAETLIADYNSFLNRNNIRNIRDYIELGNSQLFAELGAMGERFTSTATSNVKWYSSLLAKEADNPYDSYIKTALGIKQENYPLWQNAQEKVEAFADTAYRMARSAFTSFQKGIIDENQAVAISEKYGLGNPYSKATDALSAYQDIANQLPPTRWLSKIVNTANMIQSATAIRLDTFQSFINIASAPIMTLAETLSVKNLIQTTLPDGSGRAMPGMAKLIAGSIGDFFNKDTFNYWNPILKDMGIVREATSDYHSAMDAMTLPVNNWTESSIVQNLKTAVDFGAKLTGSQLTENFVRYQAAMVARRLFEAAGVEGPDLIDRIGTFVNRVHGNYIASQRPTAFQGVIGQAASLFQTYQVNLLQQLFRYVENGEGKTLALFAGLQGTLFGAQGLPGFSIINQYLATAAGNPSHKDLYSTITSGADKGLADWLLYGTVSNVTQAGLYGRGDINPRQISILPTNPLEFPAISGAISFMSNLLNTTDKLMKGGQVSTTLLNGLEHNGMSRPLSGLGQLMQGYVTTSDGSIIATTNRNVADGVDGWNDVFNAANFGRLMGARPLDEAVAMDAQYRYALYKAKDTARIEELGAAAKTYLVGKGSMPAEAVDSFATKYAAAGGWMPEFGSEMFKWSMSTNVSKANEIFRHLERPINQQMQIIMGGQKLPDYSNLPSTSNATPASPSTAPADITAAPVQ